RRRSCLGGRVRPLRLRGRGLPLRLGGGRNRLRHFHDGLVLGRGGPLDSPFHGLRGSLASIGRPRCLGGLVKARGRKLVGTSRSLSPRPLYDLLLGARSERGGHRPFTGLLSAGRSAAPLLEWGLERAAMADPVREQYRSQNERRRSQSGGRPEGVEAPAPSTRRPCLLEPRASAG